MEIFIHKIQNDDMPNTLVTFKDYFNFLGYYAKHSINGKEIKCFYTEKRSVFYVPCDDIPFRIMKEQLLKLRMPTIIVEVYNKEQDIRNLFDLNPGEFV